MTVLTEGLGRAFAAFGGVPEELLFDQMRAVAISDDRLTGGGIVLNAQFLRFAAHWGFKPRSCRPCRARTKGKVERPIRYLRESLHHGRDFLDDGHVNEEVEHWLVEVANVRRHGTTGERPLDRFERDERGVLKPLARQSHRAAQVHRLADAAPRQVPRIDVERRPLRACAELVRRAPRGIGATGCGRCWRI